MSRSSQIKATFTLCLLAVVAAGHAGCARSDAEESAPAAATVAGPALSFQEVASPAGPGSSVPTLHVAGGGEVFLSWIAPGLDQRAALRFARRDGDAWTAPQTIAEGDDWFVNWADFPSLIVLDDGAMAAHFLVKSAANTYAYDVHVTRSTDDGRTWTPPVIPHRDGTPTEHGFVSMTPAGEGRLLAVWLDGRNTGGEGHDGHGGGPMTLRTAILDPDGALHDEAELDPRVCDCCQTAAARTPHGVLVAYRDRSDREIRDISLVRLGEDGWSPPSTLHEDGWKIEGCPVNGPAVATDGARVAVAWFTAPNDKPRVHVAFSTDEGRTFGPPTAVDDGHPIGRVDAVLLPDGAALVTWVASGDDGAEIRARRILPDGTRNPSVTVAATSSARSSGFPRLARTADAVYVAWTQAGREPTVRTAVARLPGS